MNKITILLLATTFIVGISISAEAEYGSVNEMKTSESTSDASPPAGIPAPVSELMSVSNPDAIPVWVDQNFRWYAEGKIQQSELVNAIKYLIDNDIMVLDPEKGAAITNAAVMGFNGGQFGTIDKPTFGEKFIMLPSIPPSDVNEDKRYWLVKLELNKMGEQNKELASWYEEATSYYNEVQSGTESMPDEESWQEFLNQMNWAYQQLYGDESIEPPEKVWKIVVKNNASNLISELLYKGVTTNNDWEDVIDQIAIELRDETVDSVVDELAGIVVLCSIPMEKELQVISTELEYIEMWFNIASEKSAESVERSPAEREADLDFMEKRITSISSKLASAETGLSVLQEKIMELEVQDQSQRYAQSVQLSTQLMSELQNTERELVDKLQTMKRDIENQKLMLNSMQRVQ